MTNTSVHSSHECTYNTVLYGSTTAVEIYKTAPADVPESLVVHHDSHIGVLCTNNISRGERHWPPCRQCQWSCPSSSRKDGRGNRLNQKYSSEIFSGAPFDGVEAKKYGLIDGFSSLRELKKEQGVKDIVNYSRKKSLFERLSNEMGAEVMYKAFSSVGMKLQY